MNFYTGILIQIGRLAKDGDGAGVACIANVDMAENRPVPCEADSKWDAAEQSLHAEALTKEQRQTKPAKEEASRSMLLSKRPVLDEQIDERCTELTGWLTC